jgi:hypothetical protein
MSERTVTFEIPVTVTTSETISTLTLLRLNVDVVNNIAKGVFRVGDPGESATETTITLWSGEDFESCGINAMWKDIESRVLALTEAETLRPASSVAKATLGDIISNKL